MKTLSFVKKRLLLKKRGFTLLEVIIVISTISILSGLSLPKFTGIIKDSKLAAMRVDIDIIENAINMYSINSEDYDIPIKGSKIEKSTLPNTLIKELEEIGDNCENIYMIDNDKLSNYIQRTKFDRNDYLFSLQSKLVLSRTGKIDSRNVRHHSNFQFSILSNNEDNIPEKEEYPIIKGSSDEWEIEGSTIVGYKGDETSIVIPNIVDDVKITAIKGNEEYNTSIFKDLSMYIKELTIKGDIDIIDDYAFVNLTNLEKLDIEGVDTISNKSFLNAGNWSQNGIDITIKDIRDINSNAFKDIFKANSLVIENIKDIREGAFENLGSYTTENTIEITNVTNISDRAFINTTKTTSLIIENVDTISDSAFENCGSYANENIIKIMNGDSISNSAFKNTYKTKKLVVNNFKTITNSAFENIGSWTTGNIIELSNVDLIDNLAFTNAKKIRELSIINFNKIIGSSFYNSLSEVENANIYIAKGNLIGDSAFMNSKKVSSIKLDSIKEISTNAFTNSARDSLSIDINISNVDLISSYSFSNIYPKLSLTLKNVKEITGGTFANCYNLFEVTIPNTVFNISSNIFEECYNLKNIYIEPDNMEIFNILKDNYSNINVEYINKN